MASGARSLKYSAPKLGPRSPSSSSSSSSGRSPEHVSARTPEEKLLKNYFVSISEFKFELARETCDRERESKAGSKTNSNWCEFMSILSRLANAEISYYSLSSVERASLSRRARKEHSLRSTYELLILELRKVQEVYQLGRGGSDFSWERKLADLLVHIIEYASAKRAMLEFYLTFDLTYGCHLEYEKLEEFVKNTSERFRDSFHHTFLKPARSMFQKELGLLTDLLQAQRRISEWQFLPAILAIQSCETRLSNWYGVVPLDMESLGRRQLQKSIKSRPYVPSSPHPMPYLYKWWCKFHLSLLSKFSLYFYEVLSEHASVYDMKYLSQKLDTDYIASFLSLIRSTNAACVCLVFDSTGIPDFKGPKYSLPDAPSLELTGVNSYPFMIQVPHDFEFHHHRANIVSLIMGKSYQLNTSTQHVSQYDEVLRCAYHLTQLEPRVTLVVVVNSRGSRDKDSKITTWISEIAIQIRNTYVASLLRPL